MKLLIHGVPDTGYMWTPLVQALELDADTYTAPTMPGFDGHLPDDFPATSEAYLNWVVEKLEATALIHGPVDLVGHDWGAPLVAMAAQRRPDLIRTWTIINAAPEPSYKWHKLARLWQRPFVGEIFMALGGHKKFREQLIASGMPEDIAEHEAPLINRSMKRAILKLYRSAKDPSEWKTDFSNIASKGLILWGADDPFVPISIARRFAERWNITLCAEQHAGHWGLCERPERFASHLRAHWAA